MRKQRDYSQLFLPAVVPHYGAPALTNFGRELSEDFGLRSSAVANFFASEGVDVPACFAKSKSLKRGSSQTLLMKMVNLLFRRGEKTTTMRNVTAGARLFFGDRVDMTGFRLAVSAGRSVCFRDRYDFVEFFPSSGIVSPTFAFPHPVDEFAGISSSVPVAFAYFVYGVDKNIRKFSRGKSGKYAFVWKYVAPFRRKNFSLRQVAREIRFNPGRGFNDRFAQTFSRLRDDPRSSFA